MTARPNAVPDLTLLMECEPQYRVFFRNLGDAVFRRSEPPVYLSSKPARFWGDVFVYTGIPWMWILESCLLHVMVMSLWILLQTVTMQHQPLLRKDLYRSHITYYPPSFPARESRPPTLPVPRPARTAPAPSTPEQKLRVAREQHKSRGLTTPPDLKTATAKPPDLGSPAAVPPAVPMAATGTSRRALPVGPNSVVAPPPDIGQRTGRGFALPGASAVAPAPDTQGLSGHRTVNGVQSSVVGPPPTMPMSTRKMGDVNIGRSDVVAPAPQLPMHEQHTLPASTNSAMANAAGSVVAPPPSSVERGPGSLANGRSNSLGNALTQVVPPPPDVSSSKVPGTPSRGAGLRGTGSQVVPPPPLEVARGGSGSSRLRGLAPGASAIGPPPAVSGSVGATNGTRQPGAAGGAGGTSTTASTGRGNTGAGLPGGLLPGEIPSAAGYGSTSGAGSGAAGTGNEALAGEASPSADIPENTRQNDENARAPQELPLRLISAALTLPSSSYFSNYEVYIAEMRLRKAQTQLIKLVYMSLPYQRRLTDYLQRGSRVYKLRVTRDPSCDETLMQMTWPEFDGAPSSHDEKESKSKLPCYRTTADDYRKAMDHTEQPSNKSRKK